MNEPHTTPGTPWGNGRDMRLRALTDFLIPARVVRAGAAVTVPMHGPHPILDIVTAQRKLVGDPSRLPHTEYLRRLHEVERQRRVHNLVGGGPMCRCGSRRTAPMGASSLMRQCQDCGVTYLFRLYDGAFAAQSIQVAEELDRSRRTWREARC